MRRRKAIDEIFTEDAVFYEPKGGVYRGRDEIDRVAGELRVTHRDFRYQPIGKPEEVEMADVFDGQRADPVRHQQWPGLTSSLPAMAGLPLFIFFSISYHDPNWYVL